AVLNLLTNDKLADGSAATTALTDVDLDLVTAGVQHTLTVTGEGVWTYDPATGNVTFDPNTGFTINPTVINYRLIETISGRTDDATITVTYVPTNPDAVNDALSGVLPGANAVLNLLTNDKLADGSAATTALTTIDLDLVTPGTQTTLTVAGEGVWTYDPATGQVTFDPNVGFTVNPTVITYRLTETISGRTDDATITVTYVLTNPDAVNDTSTGNIPGVNAVVNILTNDKLADGSPAVPSLITVDIDPSTPGVQTVLTVPTEGVWTYDPVTGNLTFDPNVGFTISPTPIPYELKENITGLTDQATVIVTYVPTNPDAVNDSSTGHLPGTNAVLNLLTNDKLADGSTATPTLATVDLDLTIPGVQTTRTVAGEGVWTYDPATGNVTFDPNTGFTVNPTVIGYRLIETVSGRTDDATITVTYVPTDPDAVNDSSIGNVPGANTVINILTNDKLADGSPATPALTTVDLDPITPGVQLILTVPGEGVWTYNPATGDLTFDPNVGFTKSPTPIPYTLTEVITGRTDVATVTINYTLAPPDAINDSSLNNTPGSTVSLNIMANDKLADASAVTLPLVTVDLDLTTAGIQTTRTVAGEGVWTYNAATGSISFAPYAGYTINPTPIPYQLTEVLTGLTDNAVVTITYLALNPDAINDASSGHNPGTTASLNLLTNDKLSDGTAATAALVSVDLDLNTPGVQTTLTVTGEGTWTYNPATGIASFAPIAGFTIDPTPITYRLIENITGLGDNATITITYVKLPPDAINDTSTGNTPGSNVTINILTNDKLSDGTAVALSRITVDLDLATPGIQTTRTVAGEGVWTYNASTGNITFDPNPGFTIDPTPITYRLIENSTLLTDDALITITYIKLPPDAVNDFGTSTAPGVSPSVNILTNDKLSDGSPVTIGNITIDLDINTPGTQNTLVVAGEGTWTYNPATGVVTFTPIPGYIKDPTPITYRLTENSTGLSDTAVITMTSTVNLSLGLAKAETNLKRELNGSFTITYLFTVKNHGNVPLVNVSVIDNLRNVFKLPMEISVRNVTTSGTLKANTAYTGVGNNELLAAGSTLPVGKTETIQLVVNVLANGNFSTFLNTAMATANGDQVGGTTTDVSTNGTNTDPNGNNVPTDANEDVQTPVTLTGTDVVIPGGFSPNGDGINDKLVIENTENKRIDLEIYNRWGNIVYKNKDYKNEWDGVCNTGIYIGQQVPDGTYYYIVRIEGEKRPVKFITINR
ncbi:MAG: Ig-like domain-containing protein, partial [Pedobacter sp.]|nr:Ig-like domain-containing protein [Pedobacter sp.]